jgi:hypothetical protein
MDTLPPPAAPDPGYLRTRSAYHHLIHILNTSLPPPIPNTSEVRAERNSAAVAQIAALCPANPAEALLAAQFVAANAQAMECLRLTHDLATPGHLTLKCNAQAASMMRQAQGAMRTLLQAQAARARRNSDADAWAEQIAGELMTEKLTYPAEPSPSEAPVQEAPAQEAPAQKAPAQKAPAQEPSPHKAPGQEAPAHEPPAQKAPAQDPSPHEPPAREASAPRPAPDAEPALDPDRLAEFYTALYPQRAAAIRHAGGLPPDAGFPPPDEQVMRALLAGNAGAPARPDRKAA